MDRRPAGGTPPGAHALPHRTDQRRHRDRRTLPAPHPMKHPDPKPRRRARLWLGLPAVLLIFVLQMPASHLAALANDWCAGQCRLASVDGPWWAGRGFLFIKSQTDRGWHALGAMSWQLLPARNELAELHLGGGTAVLQIDTQGLHLRLDGV